MRLTDLDPNWCRSEDGRHGQGVTFDCPHCRTRRLAVWFANPLDGGAAAEDVNHIGERLHLDPRWQRDGDTFETLTLHPSVGASAHGHWHGFITNGEVTTC